MLLFFSSKLRVCISSSIKWFKSYSVCFTEHFLDTLVFVFGALNAYQRVLHFFQARSRSQIEFVSISSMDVCQRTMICWIFDKTFVVLYCENIVRIVFNQTVMACHQIPCLSLLERSEFFLVNFLCSISFFEFVFLRRFVPLLGAIHH